MWRATLPLKIKIFRWMCFRAARNGGLERPRSLRAPRAGGRLLPPSHPPTVAAATAALPCLLPPPPARLPEGFMPQVISVPTVLVPADPDRRAPHPPSPACPAASSGIQEVPETPPELLRRPTAREPLGISAARFNAAGGWSGLANAFNASPAGSSLPPSPQPSRCSGLEAERARHGCASHPPRRSALPSTRRVFNAGQRPPPPS
jgi:hypothetical protein